MQPWNDFKDLNIANPMVLPHIWKSVFAVQHLKCREVSFILRKAKPEWVFLGEYMM